MQKIIFIIIGVLIISGVLYSTQIKTNKPTATTNETAVPAETPKSIAVPVERNVNNDLIVKNCGLKYYPEAYIKMSLPSDWKLNGSELGSYEESGSYEFTNNKSQKITIRCGGALDPGCGAEEQVKITFQDKDAVFSCYPADNGVRSSVANDDDTKINITFSNFTLKEAQDIAGTIRIN